MIRFLMTFNSDKIAQSLGNKPANLSNLPEDYGGLHMKLTACAGNRNLR